MHEFSVMPTTIVSFALRFSIRCCRLWGKFCFVPKSSTTRVNITLFFCLSIILVCVEQAHVHNVLNVELCN